MRTDPLLPLNNVSPLALAPGWWAIYTKHQHEKKVAEQLQLRGAEVFLPLYTAIHRWKDRGVKLSLPLFPCYLFIRENPRMRLSSLTTPGVFLMVGNSSGYAVISDDEIQNLRRALNGQRDIQPHPFLQVGDRVRVTSGPLDGVEGFLVRRKNVCRVVLSVEMLAQSASVEVNEWEIASAPKRRDLVAPVGRDGWPESRRLQAS